MAYLDSKFAEEAMDMSAAIAYSEKNYSKSLDIYKRMADRASSQEVRLQALMGALRSAWMAKDQTEVESVASVLLQTNKLSPELENEARYYLAKVLVAGRDADAIKQLEILAKDTRNVYGAEAKYLLAQFYFDQGNTAQAEREVLDYIEVSTPHAYWLARSFVLLSDVYMKMGRNLDAKQYLLFRLCVYCQWR